MILRTPDAESDLISIWNHVVDQTGSFSAADRVIDAIDEKCRLYATTPEGGTPRPDLAPRVRCFSVYEYVIIYLPTDAGIHVLRVIHGHRDVPEEFRTSRFGRNAE